MKIKLIRGVKCEKLYSKNRRKLITQALKILPEWNGLSGVLAYSRTQISLCFTLKSGRKRSGYDISFSRPRPVLKQ